jgi:hypothetical protein
LLLVCGGCASASSFSPTLPVGVPSVAGWEKSEARAELERPRRTVEYQLFVRPGREATYEVIRYRVTYSDARERARVAYTPNERLQWDLNGRTLRRFELVPGAEGARWEELAVGSERFTRETGVILSLMSLHRELLHLRDSEAR